MGERYVSALVVLRERYVNALAALRGRYVSALAVSHERYVGASSEGTVAYRRLPECRVFPDNIYSRAYFLFKLSV